MLAVKGMVEPTGTSGGSRGCVHRLPQQADGKAKIGPLVLTAVSDSNTSNKRNKKLKTQVTAPDVRSLYIVRSRDPQ